MKNLKGEAKKLSIHISEKDTANGEALYEAILSAARAADLAGVTIFRGLYSYGRDKVIHSMGILRISEDLPLLIQIIDTKENIQNFIPNLRKIAPEALILLDNVTIIPTESA